MLPIGSHHTAQGLRGKAGQAERYSQLPLLFLQHSAFSKRTAPLRRREVEGQQLQDVEGLELWSVFTWAGNLSCSSPLVNTAWPKAGLVRPQSPPHPMPGLLTWVSG